MRPSRRWLHFALVRLLAEFLGRWAPDKGVVELVRGYRELTAPRPRLVVAGADADGGVMAREVEAACEGERDVIRPGVVTGPTSRSEVPGARNKRS